MKRMKHQISDIRRCSYLLLFIGAFTACEIRTVVKLQGGTQPSFVLSGSGILGGVRIYGPTGKLLWEIEAQEAPGKPLSQLNTIIYGIVPNSYRQVVPQMEVFPDQLVPGERYKYDFVTGNAPGAIGYFEIKDGNAIEVDSSENR